MRHEPTGALVIDPADDPTVLVAGVVADPLDPLGPDTGAESADLELVDAALVAIGPEAFCREIHPRLVGSLRLYLCDIESARELAQDALVRVIERWPQVRAMEHPQAWTYRVAFNLARSRLRRGLAEARARRRSDTPPAASWGVDVAEVLAVRAAVAGLPPRQRQAVVLRFYSDLTVDQIGEAMGCRPGTVKAHLHQGLAALRAAGLRNAGDDLIDPPEPHEPHDATPTTDTSPPNDTNDTNQRMGAEDER